MSTPSCLKSIKFNPINGELNIIVQCSDPKRTVKADGTPGTSQILAQTGNWGESTPVVIDGLPVTVKLSIWQSLKQSAPVTSAGWTARKAA